MERKSPFKYISEGDWMVPISAISDFLFTSGTNSVTV